MAGAGSLSIPKESKTKQSLILALFVHLALLAFLWIGVSWQSEQGGSADGSTMPDYMWRGVVLLIQLKTYFSAWM